MPLFFYPLPIWKEIIEIHILIHVLITALWYGWLLLVASGAHGRALQEMFGDLSKRPWSAPGWRQVFSVATTVPCRALRSGGSRDEGRTCTPGAPWEGFGWKRSSPNRPFSISFNSYFLRQARMLLRTAQSCTRAGGAALNAWHWGGSWVAERDCFIPLFAVWFSKGVETKLLKPHLYTFVKKGFWGRFDPHLWWKADR